MVNWSSQVDDLPVKMSACGAWCAVFALPTCQLVPLNGQLVPLNSQLAPSNSQLVPTNSQLVPPNSQLVPRADNW